MHYSSNFHLHITHYGPITVRSWVRRTLNVGIVRTQGPVSSKVSVSTTKVEVETRRSSSLFTFYLSIPRKVNFYGKFLTGMRRIQSNRLLQFLVYVEILFSTLQSLFTRPTTFVIDNECSFFLELKYFVRRGGTSQST